MSDKLPKGWATAPLAELVTTLESGSRPRGGVRGILEGVPSIGGEHLNYNGGGQPGSLKLLPQKFSHPGTRGGLPRPASPRCQKSADPGQKAFFDSHVPL